MVGLTDDDDDDDNEDKDDDDNDDDDDDDDDDDNLTLLIPSYSSLVCPAGSSYSPPSGPPEMGWVILLQLSGTPRVPGNSVVTD